MKVTVKNEAFFKEQDFETIRKLAIHGLSIQPDKLAGKQPEHFKRAMIRQVFVKNHSYGEEFDLPEEQKPYSNPFGKPRRKVKSTTVLSGEYKFNKNGLRATEGDIRNEMMKVIENNTSFEAASEEWHKSHSHGEKYQVPNGKLLFTFEAQIQWALKLNWIERV
jgi:hypothetical protein